MFNHLSVAFIHFLFYRELFSFMSYHICLSVSFFYFCQIFVCHMCFFSFQSNSLILFNWNKKVRTSSLCSNENEIVRTLPSCSNEMNCLNSLISFKFMHLLRITFLFLSSFLICSNDKEIIWNFLFCSNENEIVRILSFCLNLCVCHALHFYFCPTFLFVQMKMKIVWTFSSCSNEKEVVRKICASVTRYFVQNNAAVTQYFVQISCVCHALLCSNLCGCPAILCSNLCVCHAIPCSNLCVCHAIFCSSQCVCYALHFIYVELSYLFKWKWKLFELSHLFKWKWSRSENLCVCYVLLCSNLCVCHAIFCSNLSRDILFMHLLCALILNAFVISVNLLCRSKFFCELSLIYVPLYYVNTSRDIPQSWIPLFV